MLTFKIEFVLGVDFSEIQVLGPVSSTWGGSILYVFAFIVKTDMHCSVNL